MQLKILLLPTLGRDKIGDPQRNRHRSLIQNNLDIGEYKDGANEPKSLLLARIVRLFSNHQFVRETEPLAPPVEN